VPEHDMRVGHRRQAAAAPIARGPRLGPGAGRPDRQRSILDPRDRPAPGPHRHHVDHRQRQRPLSHPPLLRKPDPALVYQADIRAGAADIDGDQVLDPGRPRHLPRAHDARGRANLHVVGDALVEAVQLEGNRPHASGVRVRVDGHVHAPRAVREVILCAGAIHSPALLQRSGIGPAALLRGLGITVAADLPVGENLLDHPIVGGLLHLRPGARVDTLMHRHTNCCLRYSSGLAGAGENDMIMIAGNLAGALLSQAGPDAARGRLAVSVYQAFSQGHVRVTTTDPAVDPAVEERMLSDERDLVRLRDGVRRLEAICADPAIQAVAERVEYGASGRSMADTLDDAALDEWLFAECSDAQHASGTCRMGAAGDPRAVVDTDCRVIGCTGLRVIDASVMPEVPRANTHLTTVAIAERMADVLRGRA